MDAPFLSEPDPVRTRGSQEAIQLLLPTILFLGGAAQPFAGSRLTGREERSPRPRLSDETTGSGLKTPQARDRDGQRIEEPGGDSGERAGRRNSAQARRRIGYDDGPPPEDHDGSGLNDGLLSGSCRDGRDGRGQVEVPYPECQRVKPRPASLFELPAEYAERKRVAALAAHPKAARTAPVGVAPLTDPSRRQILVAALQLQLGGVRVGGRGAVRFRVVRTGRGCLKFVCATRISPRQRNLWAINMSKWRRGPQVA